MAVADVIEPHHTPDVSRAVGVALPRDVALLQLADALSEELCSAGTVDAMVARTVSMPATRLLRIVPAAIEVTAETLLANRESLDEM